MTHAHHHRYDPWDHAGRLGLRIVFRDLPANVMGYWHQPSRVIVIDDRLTQAEQRCTLAHELVHVERGDDGQCPGWYETKLERIVHTTAARRLIHLDELALALLIHDHERDQAEELWVDIDTLRTRLARLTATEHAELLTRFSLARRVRS